MTSPDIYGLCESFQKNTEVVLYQEIIKVLKNHDWIQAEKLLTELRTKLERTTPTYYRGIRNLMAFGFMNRKRVGQKVYYRLSLRAKDIDPDIIRKPDPKRLSGVFLDPELLSAFDETDDTGMPRRYRIENMICRSLKLPKRWKGLS